MPRKPALLKCDEVAEAYNQTGDLRIVAKLMNVDRATLMKFMDRNNIPRKRREKVEISKQDIQAAYDELKSTRLLADRFKVSRSYIVKLCREYGIELEQKESPARLIPEIAKLTNEGLDNFQIAERLNVTAGYINEVARNSGIKLNRRYHKGYIITHNGYKMVNDKNHPDADSKGYVREHRKVLAETLGIEALPKNIVCHHKDGNKLNNSPDNLEPMSLIEHAKHHRQEQISNKI